MGGKKENGKLGTSKQIHKPKETWIRIPNIHPAIITPELFDAVSEKRRNTVCNGGQLNTSRMLYKKVWCGHCGHSMLYRSDTEYPFYHCGTARYSEYYGCPRGKIREQDILNAVKDAVQAQVKVLLEYEKLCQALKKELKKRTASAQPIVMRHENGMKRLRVAKRQLYERYKNNLITKQDYLKKRDVLETEIAEKTAGHDTLISKNEEQAKEYNPVHQFFEYFVQYRALPELHKKMVDELIEMICIYNDDKIEIQYTFSDEK